MPLSIASKGAVTTSTATLSTASFTPPAGSLLVVNYFGFLNAAGTVSISDNFGDTGGGTWTPFTGNATTVAAFGQPYGGWYRVIGSGAAAGTVTVSATNFGGGNQSLAVDQVTTSSGTLSVPQTNAVAASFSATGSVSLASAPNTASLVWSAAGAGQSGRTPTVTTTGFTQLDLVNTSSSNATAYKNTSGPTTTAWSGLSTSQVNALVACEVAVATSGGSVTANATVANATAAAPNASARVAPPPGNYSLFQTTTGSDVRSGPSTTFSYTGNFISGVLFTVSRGMWFEGFYYWVAPSGQSTTPQKFALWGLRYNTSTFAITGVLLAQATSGTLTAGAWNYIPLAAPVQLATGGSYVAQTGVNGNYPRTLSEFASGGRYASGLTSGPLFAFGGGSLTAWPAGPYCWIGGSTVNGVFSTAGSDPTVTLATTNSDQNENLWMDVLVSDFPPSGFSNYRIWPNNPDCWKYAADDASPYNIATEFNISVTCQLQRVWYFSPPGVTTLGSSCSLWTMTSGGLAGSVVSGTLNSSPTWLHPDGSAASPGDGWVYCDYSSLNIFLPAGNYKVSVANTNNVTMGAKSLNYWDTGPGQAGILTGPITAPGLSTASQAYNYNGGIPGSTPPFTDGTTVQGQSTFSRNVNPGSAATYPSLFVVGIAQAYWVDVELTPPPVLNVSGQVANASAGARPGVAGAGAPAIAANASATAQSPSVNITSGALASAQVANAIATAAAPSVSTNVPSAFAIAGVANAVALAPPVLVVTAGGLVVAQAQVANALAQAPNARGGVPDLVYMFSPPAIFELPTDNVENDHPAMSRLMQYYRPRPSGVAVYKMDDGTYWVARNVPILSGPGIVFQEPWPPLPLADQVNGAINQTWLYSRMVSEQVQQPGVLKVYYGGTSYPVTQDEAELLVAAGFEGYVEIITEGDRFNGPQARWPTQF